MMTEEMIDLIDCDTSRVDVAEMRADYLQKELDDLANKYELMVRRNCELTQQSATLQWSVNRLNIRVSNRNAEIDTLRSRNVVLRDDMILLNKENTELVQAEHMQEQMESDFYEDCPF